MAAGVIKGLQIAKLMKKIQGQLINFKKIIVVDLLSDYSTQVSFDLI